MGSSLLLYSYALMISLAFFTKRLIFPVREEKLVSVLIERDSHLKILGTTNINSFSCAYQGNIGADTLSINVQRTENEILLDHAQLSVEVARFDCGHSGMNKDFRALLEHEQYPLLKVRLASLNLSPEKNYEALAEVIIEIAGKLESYTVPVQLKEEDGEVFYVGRQALNIRDFELTPPKKFLGMIVVDEEVIIDFKLNLSLL
ncbi:YceI family protein [Catalinimonas sp. 4WD22]|uniref:YceI family protein n=1 Tax=Catalinimonas locisalis TaxID=3133978 RepID=UPI0031011C39